MHNSMLVDMWISGDLRRRIRNTNDHRFGKQGHLSTNPQSTAAINER